MSTVLPSLALRKDPQSDLDEGKLSPTVSVATLGAPVELEASRSFWRRPKRELDSIATQPSVFDDPVTLEVYRPPPAYENAHRFDPDARWTWREEYAIVRKIDWRVMLWAFIMFFALDLDRSNISQANTDNFLQDLNMTTDDFNLGNALFPLCFLIAELPSQLISKRVGPDVWIPSQMVLWSLVSGSQYWLSGRTSFLVTRCLLGFMQGGFIPDVILYLSYFYTKTELPIRLAWFWVSNYVAALIGTFLATGILQLRHVTGVAGWRYLFLIEGILTLVVGVASFFMMPPSPTQTKAWYRPNGWFNEREEIIIVNRVLRDDPSKSDMHNRQGLDLKLIWKVLKDWRLWPLYILGMTHFIPVTPPQTYLTLSLRNLGFDTTQSNLLTVPSTVLGIIMLLVPCYLSEIWDSRTGATIILQLWALPLLVALYTFTEQTSQWVYFAVVTLITAYPYVHPVQVAWVSTNSNSVATRTVSASLYNMFVQSGTVISSYIYVSSDAPLYKKGNGALIGIAVLNLVIYAFTYFFYRGLNKRRDRIWNSWTPEEQQKYLDTTTDQGSEKINFRFAY
ncbi:MFS general substrate transporter [Obba rivulosa]|uniref:MFS general substrate transporter n=1 Tax=Obba rivulosa TaxID=1052685 RepID=A0A8E2B415_9APHY|nr:MFS general substrate transporter [Obba rivulosa]